MEETVMTGAVAFFLAAVAGWLVFDRRRAAIVVIVPFLAVLAVQTWHIAAGKGVSPPSTVNKFPDLIGYYVVQVIILGLAFGAGDQIRKRRARSSSTASRPALAIKINAALSALVVVAFLVAGSALDPGSVAHHSAEGHPPWPGYVGIVLSAVVWAALGLSSLKSRRSGSSDGVQSDAGVSTGAIGPQSTA
jgi:hypothetical protein